MGGSRRRRNRGLESSQQKGGLAMETRPPDFPTTLQPTSPRIAELDRLGDEIAELSAHLDAATARLLDLIREFDAREGWNTGFRSCAAWLSWRVGLDLGAARERVRVARALGTLPRLAQALAWGAPARRTMSNASCAAGAGWTGRLRRSRSPDGTRAVRCTCIRTRTAW